MFQPHGAYQVVVLVLVALLGCVKRPVDYERDAARTLAPAKLEHSQPGRVRYVVKVRVYADADYRDAISRFDSRIRDQFRRASNLMEAELGVSFVVIDILEWSHRDPRGDRDHPSSLNDALLALEALDPGSDVDLVVGMVTGLPMVSASQDQLGLARMFGRHCVVRNMESIAEAEAFRAWFKHLPDHELEALYAERKAHKETSVLVHEWAHTLGAFHVPGLRWMMSAEYDVKQARLPPPMLGLLEVGLRHRQAGEADDVVAWARELKALIAGTRAPEWEGPDRDRELAALEEAIAGRQVELQTAEAPGPASPAPATASKLGRADLARSNEVAAAIAAKKFEQARRLLDELRRGHPDDPRVLELGCGLASDSRAPEAEVRDQCGRAAERSTSLVPLAVMTQLAVRTRSHAEIEARSVALHQRVEQVRPTQPEAWVALASVFADARQLTWAEDAAAHASLRVEAQQVSERVRRLRAWSALPRGDWIAPADEARLVRLGREVVELFDRRALAEANRAIAALEREFPEAPVRHVLRCELQLRKNALAQARTACEAAIAADPDAIQGHYLLAQLFKTAGQPERAAPELERVVELDPDHPDAWKELRDAYLRMKAKDRAAEVSKKYRAQFATELR